MEETPDRLTIACSGSDIRVTGWIVLGVGLLFSYGMISTLLGPPLRSDQVPVIALFSFVSLGMVILGIRAIPTKDQCYTFDRPVGTLLISATGARISLAEIARAELAVNTGSDVDTYGVRLVLIKGEFLDLHLSTSSTIQGECRALADRINQWLA